MINEDLSLVERTLQGDKEAFGQLVIKHETMVFNLAYRMVGSREEAADMAQEAFLRAYRSLHTYKAEFKFSTWVCRIASHACIDYLRRQRVHAVSAEDLERLAGDGGEPSPHEKYEQSETAGIIQQAIASLPEKYRVAILLRYIEDMTYEDIALALDMPLGTVKTHLRRARLMLKDKLNLSKEGVLSIEMC
ncbi:MAG: sigma-70 family RNA polymerase sigma factor [bacterium]|nr:sigma-70 family RNA polymerase sigma factor [bacterium]MDD3805419.1 sigma-70 family RNA polymerase sigma factor [bacterium]MDD4152174.1 sigma-70 family RNA polymerase sigma factor [bacterium]MDD4557690.1 sigma-70 family RNA polymerase sigma factor [bacterium]